MTAVDFSFGPLRAWKTWRRPAKLPRPSKRGDHLHVHTDCSCGTLLNWGAIMEKEGQTFVILKILWSLWGISFLVDLARCAERLTAGKVSHFCESTKYMWNAGGVLNEGLPTVFHKVSKILYFTSWKWNQLFPGSSWDWTDLFQPLHSLKKNLLGWQCHLNVS